MSFFGHLKTAAGAITVAIALHCVPSAEAQEDTAAPAIVVRGDELPSAYGAPPAFSRTRFAPLTTAYVLPPGSFLAATIYEGDIDRHGPPDHRFTQEIEVGLPHRFGFAAEASFESFDGTMQARTVSLEGRYALADWNKIPLNPTIFAEYKFGIGRVLQEEGGEEEEGVEAETLKYRLRKLTRHPGATKPEEDEEEEFRGRPELPDAIEGRLLLSQDFAEKVEWSLNAFIEQETSGDRGREWGFAQSVVVPLTRKETLKVGAEMLYTNFTDKGTRDDPAHSFVIGPTFAWKTSRVTRLDVSPLFGVTDDSPAVQVFAVFSLLFGPDGGSGESEAPASTRNR
ncbi:MAG: hypothetical protein H0X73_15340 [Chthoniobacterales bacterium]|nr:hypothetical protein [Chthoniobacterales bacterium]